MRRELMATQISGAADEILTINEVLGNLARVVERWPKTLATGDSAILDNLRRLSTSQIGRFDKLSFITVREYIYAAFSGVAGYSFPLRLPPEFTLDFFKLGADAYRAIADDPRMRVEDPGVMRVPYIKTPADTPPAFALARAEQGGYGFGSLIGELKSAYAGVRQSQQLGAAGETTPRAISLIFHDLMHELDADFRTLQPRLLRVSNLSDLISEIPDFMRTNGIYDSGVLRGTIPFFFELGMRAARAADRQHLHTNEPVYR